MFNSSLHGNSFSKRCIRRIAVLAFSLILASSAQAQNGSKLPVAPGQLIDVGTHKLHIYCKGEGRPSIIIDAGLGSVAMEWGHVQDLLSRQVKTCIYDRAGYGWSGAGPLPRTSERIASELKVLLARAGIPAPYVLMGHSFGGYNMQVYASHNPSRVAGLVLVDSSHPEQVQRFEADPINLKTAPRRRTGVVRYSLPVLPDNVPAEMEDLLFRLLVQMKARKALGDEMLDFRTSAAQVLAAGALPDVPMLILTRGIRVYPHDRRGDLMEALWSELQKELAARTEHSAHLIASNSKHHIHLDQPALLTDSIAYLLENIEQRRMAQTPWGRHIDPSTGHKTAFQGSLVVSDRLSAQPGRNEHNIPGLLTMSSGRIIDQLTEWAP